jgi:D-alanyl-D-alanine carboxypeptidase
MKLFVILLLACLAGGKHARSEDAGEFAKSYARSNHFAGTVLIYSGGKLQFHQAFGFANLEFQVTNAPSTKFRIASITKLFTAVLIMQLQESGKLNLAKTISEYLPSYKGPGASKVTLRHLLTHTSGIENMDTVGTMVEALKEGIPVYQRPMTLDQLIERHCSGRLVNQPGSVFDYNNADYVILGKVIEVTTKASFAEALRDGILRKAGMVDSGLCARSEIVPRLAETYFYREELHRLTPDLPVYWENWHAAGAMYSTAEDLLRFSNALFGGRLLSAQSLQEMLQSGAGEYGFGTWVYNDYEIATKRYTVVKRPGRIMGAQSVLFHVLGTDSTVIILSNTSRTNLDHFAAAIAARLSGLSL